jgi:hypothetical protein
LIEAGKPSKTSSRFIPLQLIGKISVFWRFVRSPEVYQKKSRISLRVARSCFLGLTKITALSAYKNVLIPFNLGVMWCITPLSVARWRNFWRGSIARMKSMGEIGSP